MQMAKRVIAVYSLVNDEMIFLISWCLLGGKYFNNMGISFDDQDPFVDYEFTTLLYEDGPINEG